MKNPLTIEIKGFIHLTEPQGGIYPRVTAGYAIAQRKHVITTDMSNIHEKPHCSQALRASSFAFSWRRRCRRRVVALP